MKTQADKINTCEIFLYKNNLSVCITKLHYAFRKIKTRSI